MKTSIAVLLVGGGFILGLMLTAYGQQPSGSPPLPPLDMTMIQNMLTTKDSITNSVLLELEQKKAQVTQLQVVLQAKEAELKKAESEKKCQ